MNNESKGRCGRVLRYFVIGIFYLIVAALPISIGIFRPGITGYERAMLGDMIYGRAYKPFVKRQLVPLIVRGGRRFVPNNIEIWVQERFSESELTNYLGWEPRYALEYVLVLFVMYVSLVGFLIALRLFLLCFLRMSCWKSHLVVLAVGVGLPITFAGKMYIYDFTQLLLFTTCLVVLYQRRWSWFYPVYLLACINKETSILAALVLLCWRGREALKPPYLWHLLVQMAIGSSVYLTIGYIFRNNPGTALEWHLQRNVNLSITALGKLRLLALILAVVFSFLGSGRAPLFLKRGLAATLPVLLCASFFFGYVDELRAFYEALPFVVGLTLLAVGKSANIWPRSSCGVDGTVNDWPQNIA